MDQRKTKDLQEVDIEILFWGPVGEKDTGHAALHVVKPELYISFWPSVDSPGLDRVPSKAMSYADDLHETGMGREPSSVYKARIGLDMKAVSEFWELQQKKDYFVVGNNCSTAVIEALRAGNDAFKVSPYGPDLNIKDDFFVGPYTREVVEIYEKLESFLQEAALNGSNKN
ncbi:uncharacterized protein LOC119082947 [Bradysia coprophila]|uniref:uncharacterized protein LOC119082947 n=1 Tax=Bradysia coprophila TaxID=38358 RepID=UPI00187DC102|nr:uncharacterized protein LOC119082947 [Bradysia coprophila]